MRSVLHAQSPKLRVQYVRYQLAHYPDSCRRCIYHGTHHLCLGEMATASFLGNDHPNLGVAMFDRPLDVARQRLSLVQVRRRYCPLIVPFTSSAPCWMG
jgi:hypothetical protein